MKFTINAAAFSDAAAWAIRAVHARPPVPVLSGILLETSEGMIRASGFDYEKAARATAPADVAQHGRAVLPGRLLVDILGKLNKKTDITLELDGSRAIITAGKSRFNLSLIPLFEYPDLPELQPEAGTIDGNEFAAAIGRVKAAAARDQTLPILCTVHLAGDAGGLLMQATDRYRMAETTVPWKPTAGPVDWLLSIFTLEDAVRIAAGDLTILADDNGITFVSGNRSLSSTFLDGQYPKIGSLFGSGQPIEVVVDRDTLLDAATLTSTVAERNTPVRLTINGEVIQLDAGTGEDAQAVEYVPAVMTGAKDYEICFNPYYLSDALRTFPSGDVRLLMMENTAKPVTFLPGDDSLDYRLLLMPVRKS